MRAFLLGLLLGLPAGLLWVWLMRRLRDRATLTRGLNRRRGDRT